MDGIDSWVAFFSTATRRAVSDAVAFKTRVTALLEDWRSRTSDLRSDSAALALLEKLPETPLVTVRSVEVMLKRSFSVANNAVETLVDRGILESTTVAKRHRVFEARALVDAFTSLERQMASPDGNTRTSKPQRVVPSRPNR
jgi:hypothetical protein